MNLSISSILELRLFVVYVFRSGKLMTAAAADENKENAPLTPCSGNRKSSGSYNSATVDHSFCPWTNCKPIGSFPSEQPNAIIL